MANPPRPRPGSGRSRVTRFVDLARATPAWLDVDKIVAMYRVAAVLNELDLGEGAYCVDHLVPITSPLVCGLHVHDNMRILSRRSNLAKGNQFWPDMWEYDWQTLEMLLKHRD